MTGLIPYIFYMLGKTKSLQDIKCGFRNAYCCTNLCNLASLLIQIKIDAFFLKGISQGESTYAATYDIYSLQLFMLF